MFIPPDSPLTVEDFDIKTQPMRDTMKKIKEASDKKCQEQPERYETTSIFSNWTNPTTFSIWFATTVGLILGDALYIALMNRFVNNRGFTIGKIPFTFMTLSWVVLAFMLTQWVILPNKDNPREALVQGILLGSMVLFFYNMTMKSVDPNWNSVTSIIDTIWGGLLSGMVVYIVSNFVA